MRKVLRLVAIPALLSASLASSQADDLMLMRAYAAGYKAQFLCSGLFLGGKTVEQIERDELTGIYDEIADIVPELKAEIDREKKTVSVSYRNDFAPRKAIYNSVTGCTALAIGSSRAFPNRTSDDRLAPGALDERSWPVGDITPVIRANKKITAIRNLVSKTLARNGKGQGKSSAIIISINGDIVAEKYALGHHKHTSQRTWSVAKSITATYVGFVRHRMQSDFGEARDASNSLDPRRDISINNLLRMASGLQSFTAGNRTDHIYMGGGNIREWATPFPILHKQGSKFRYANNDTLIAMLKTRAEARHLHPHHFFDQLGMTRTFAETDPLGDYISSSQIWTTARDLARLGQLYLNNGLWPNTDVDSARLIPENWREYVSTPSGPQPDRKFGYGAQFWLMNKSEGIPKDTFAGFGNRGQYLVIIPSMDMVIVRRGYDSKDNRFDIEAFTRAVVTAAK